MNPKILNKNHSKYDLLFIKSFIMSELLYDELACDFSIFPFVDDSEKIKIPETTTYDGELALEWNMYFAQCKYRGVLLINGVAEENGAINNTRLLLNKREYKFIIENKYEVLEMINNKIKP